MPRTIIKPRMPIQTFARKLKNEIREPPGTILHNYAHDFHYTDSEGNEIHTTEFPPGLAIPVEGRSPYLLKKAPVKGLNTVLTNSRCISRGRLRQLRASFNLSRKELAEYFNMTEKQIARWLAKSKHDDDIIPIEEEVFIKIAKRLEFERKIRLGLTGIVRPGLD